MGNTIQLILTHLYGYESEIRLFSVWDPTCLVISGQVLQVGSGGSGRVMKVKFTVSLFVIA